MGLKHHTIIFVPHSRAKHKKWRVSDRQIRITIGAIALVTIVAMGAIASHFTTKVNLREVARLRAENAQLVASNAGFETSISQLERQLAAYEDRTKDLAIVAGLEDLIDVEAAPARSGAGVGGDLALDPSPRSADDLARLSNRATDLENQLAVVGRELDDRALLINATPSIMPVRGILTSGYGYRKDPITGRRAYHQGLDISAPKGKPVRASADGIVVRTGRVGALGRAVYLYHGMGTETRYGHLSKVNVENGQRVKRGDIIGFVGNTGRSTGYHLHYEVRENRRPRNPIEYMLDRS